MSAKALLSASVSAPPAVYVEDVFSTFLYTGNGSTQTITNGIDLSGEGGLVWIKKRSNIDNHVAFDTARGNTKQLIPNLTNAESTDANAVTSFNSSGFSLGSGGSGFTNQNADTYCSWTFRKAAKFFDVVTFTTAPGSYSATVNHSLGSTPGCIIVKCTSSGGGAGDWNVWHRSLASDKALWLQSTAAQNTPGNNWITSNSTSFSANASLPLDNATYVAYLFAHDAGGFGTAGTDSVVKCGTFMDSGGAATLDLGWEPQFVLLKRTNGTGDWIIFDNMRGWPVSGDSRTLSPNLSNAEAGTPAGLTRNIRSNGFYWESNTTNETYIYIAIRRGPMKTPTVGTEVFVPVALTGSSTTTVTTNFPVDFVIERGRGGSSNYAFDRLRGAERYLVTNSTNAEASTGFGAYFDSNVSIRDTWLGAASGGNIYWSFRRAPGFFDVVAYTGTGVARTVSHNLGVVPELMIVKSRSIGYDWYVYSKSLPSGAPEGLYNLNLNLTTSGTFDYGQFTVAPTSTVFSLNNYAGTNASGYTYIAYLFATAPGVSKVGTYTGTGTTKQIDCGFTTGARFVLIKRTDSTGDWYVWDTARGIISGSDPFLLLNSTAAEDTSTDYIDPLSSGFEISSTAPAAINANGGTYIFLSIA